MKKILVKGTSQDAVNEIKKCVEELGNLQGVTVFFNKNNFLLTSYDVMSQNVHLILSCSNAEVQVESANCGYSGGGPNATLDILCLFGMDITRIKPIIYKKRALTFKVVNNRVTDLFTDEIFYGEGYKEPNWIKFNKIEDSKNILVDIVSREVRCYNPQRHDMSVFFQLLNGLTDRTMEYYIGDKNLLDVGLQIEDKTRKHYFDEIDLDGVEHVNLIISGNEYKVVCLIDRKEEIDVINMIYYVLMGENLFDDITRKKITSINTTFKVLVKILGNKYNGLHDVVDIPNRDVK